MYGKWISVGCLAVYVLCTPKTGGAELYVAAKKILQEWTAAGWPSDEYIAFNSYTAAQKCRPDRSGVDDLYPDDTVPPNEEN